MHYVTDRTSPDIVARVLVGLGEDARRLWGGFQYRGCAVTRKTRPDLAPDGWEITAYDDPLWAQRQIREAKLAIDKLMYHAHRN